MSDHVIGSRSRAAPFGALLPLVMGAAVFVLLLLLGGRLLNDPDSYWHIVVGRWILENGAFPRADTFSHTMAGAPWIAKEWLSQVLYAQAYAAGAWGGVVLLAAIAVGSAFFLLSRFVAERMTPAPALILALAALTLTAPHLSARPHVLALPLMVCWIGGLVRALDRGSRPSLWLLPVMTLWANLHGGFTLGLAMVGPIALEAVWNAAPAARRAVLSRWAGFGLLALLAACATPYGPESILVTYRILGLGEALAIISEWRPHDFSRLAAFEVCLLLAIGFALQRGLTLPPLRILIVLGLLHLALAHDRNAEIFGLLAPLVVAAPLARQLDAAETARSDAAAGLPPWKAGLAAILLVPTGAAFIATRALSPAPGITPAAAVEAVKRLNAGPLFNDYDFGGYLLWSGVAPFIDGRTELYGGTFVARHHRAVMLANLPDFLAMLDTHRIGATLLPPSVPAVALLDRLPDWQRAHTDAVAVVHVRR
jgi:hypothetical protein